MSNVASLEWHRAKRGLPPAQIPDPRPLLERVLSRYHKFDQFQGHGVQPRTAFRALAVRCAKKVVAICTPLGNLVPDDARFQFFGAGGVGAEVLQMRVNRVVFADGSSFALTFQMDSESLEPRLLEEGALSDSSFRPLLTLPMSQFYRLR